MSTRSVSFTDKAIHSATIGSQDSGVDRQDYFSVDGVQETGQHAASASRRRASMSIRLPPTPAIADVAFTALQYLPMPILVLSSTKCVVLANEAMGRLLGIDPDNDHEEDGRDTQSPSKLVPRETSSMTAILRGYTLGQLGIDLLQNGSPVFVAWEEFLETVVDDASRAQSSTTPLNVFHGRNLDHDSTPTEPGHKRSISTGTSVSSVFSQTNGTRTEVHDAAVQVLLSTHRDSKTGLPLASKSDMEHHVQAQMIVSVWVTEDEQYFTLTFTATTTGTGPTTSEGSQWTSRTVSRASTSWSSGVPSGLSSGSSSSSNGLKRTSIQSPKQFITSPTTTPLMDFPPKGPPAKSSTASAPSMFSKTNRLKDAILNSMNIPAYALWKDESFGMPNKAAIKLLYPWIEDEKFETSDLLQDFLLHYVLYKDDFSAEIPLEEFPIMRVMREQERFEGYRVGMYSAKDGSRLLFDTSGEPLRNDNGEFLGGLVLFHDVTDYATTIEKQQEKNEHQFESICNMVPQMIWRTTPEGAHDYFSDRWYSYTGLSVDESFGEGWQNAFYPDDLQVADAKWRHSLATGEEYLTEYRCRSATGQWRWMLGRAMPMRDEIGTIVQWFGSCTDIHELVLAREEAKQTRTQLARVLEHSQITLWAVDTELVLTLSEGKPMTNFKPSHKNAPNERYIGMKFKDVLHLQERDNEVVPYLQRMRDILGGRKQGDTLETYNPSTYRYFRTRLYPLLRQERRGGIEGDSFIDGVVGISMDVTELKNAAEDVADRDRENSRLQAQSVAAKEASKMKSQFLANMSHEIRTPIAGVIGMSELLLDDDSGELTKEQRDCAENIQRSANGLLTVINDILDFSKVESGRLDIEEVQFDLSVVIRDVNKMLSFAAERKGLKYVDDVREIGSLKVMGDPGRLRQVMTNLLTNSIKFTTEGSVTMRVEVKKETSEIVDVHFTVEDTGIGIEEGVRRKLFQPFSQADSSTARRFGGTGLGLTISKNLVELMRGQIYLESKLGYGTKATFWIPFHKAPFQSSDAASVDLHTIPDRLQSEVAVSRPGSDNRDPLTPTNSKKGPRHERSGSGLSGLRSWSDGPLSQPDLTKAERGQIHILVVEDNAINQQIALKTIGRLGFTANAVWNGKEAVDYLQSVSLTHPRPDIILMDVQMPIMDGYRATYTIRNKQPFVSDAELQGTPIVAMTASAIQGDREKCQEAGMDDYLAKPVKKSLLENMLVKWAIEGKKKRIELRNDPSKLIALLKRPHNSRNTSSFTSEASSTLQSPQAQISSHIDRLELAERTAFEQNSESPNDRAMREHLTNERAISLRDHELIEAGDDPKKKLGRTRRDDGNQLPEESGATALTKENMLKFAKSNVTLRLEQEDGSPGGRNGSSAIATEGESGSNVVARTLTSNSADVQRKSG